MTQGLKEASATFQRMATNLIRGLKSCCFAYINYIIIDCSSVSNHMRDLKVLRRTKDFDMRLTPPCSFFDSEI